jgi:hypothetical protein
MRVTQTGRRASLPSPPPLLLPLGPPPALLQGEPRADMDALHCTGEGTQGWGRGPRGMGRGAGYWSGDEDSEAQRGMLGILAWGWGLRGKGDAGDPGVEVGAKGHRVTATLSYRDTEP